MRELHMQKKVRVIRLFLDGLTYDEIVQRVGISKGSVVSIINDFREGRLPLPLGRANYIDELRRVAVDLRKNGISVTKAKSLLKIHAKLQKMGVDNEQTEQWLDICQGIASSSATNDDFVDAALELAQQTSKTDLSYADLLKDYKAKLNLIKHLDEQTERRKEELNKVQLEREQAAVELDSITKKTTIAYETFRRQKVELKSEQDKYLTENKLSWERIKLVETIINSGFNNTDLSEIEVKELRKRIVAIGSLIKTTKELVERKNQQQDNIDNLKVYQQHYYKVVSDLAYDREQVEISIAEKERVKDGLQSEIISKGTELAAVQQGVADYIENLYVSRLILDFLFTPNGLSNRDLDRLVSIMIGLRQKRLGIESKKVTDANGQVICQCQIPNLTVDFELYKIDINHAREALAYYLAPLVRDKFVTKFEYDLSEMKHRISKEITIVEATLVERKRHTI